MNVGEEDQKGFDYLREAAAVLAQIHLILTMWICGGFRYRRGKVDVVVTDGFSGNVALKTAEGVADLFQGGLRTAFSENI